jgi:hypothetical protein
MNWNRKRFLTRYAESQLVGELRLRVNHRRIAARRLTNRHASSRRHLDEELESKQLKKYRDSIDNIILTDYRRFILIRGNQAIFDQSLFRRADFSYLKSHVRGDKIDEFVQLIVSSFSIVVRVF